MIICNQIFVTLLSMKTLEAAHQTDFSKVNFTERKISIEHTQTLLYGPPRAGKSYLIFDYLSKYDFEEYLYLDFKDMRIDIEEVKLNLQEYILEHNIKILAIENYESQIELPNCEEIILSSNTLTHITGFKSLLVMPLDFEEFILHNHKQQNITHSFNTFLKYGNIPGLLDFSDDKKILRMQELLRINAENQTQLEVLKMLLSSLGEKRSIFQMFNTLKKNIKISKDMFYNLCDQYEKNHLVFFVAKFNQPKAVKKLYAYNHTFLDSLSHKKNFANEFTNMVFLELFKTKEPLYYLEKIDFYIPSKNKLILCIPFFNPFQISKVSENILSHLKELEINEVQIITVGIEQTFFCDEIEVEVVPFYEWALTL